MDLFDLSDRVKSFGSTQIRFSFWFLSLLQIGNLGLHVLWYFLHFVISLWYVALGIVCALESYLISVGILKKYKALDINKLRYLALVVESEEAYQIPKIIELLQWLVALGVKQVCLYDTEGKNAWGS